MEKKKTTYRYHPSMQVLIDKGFKMYRDMYSGTMTLNAFIDICIKGAVETLPEQLQKQTTYVAELQGEISALQEKNEELMQTIRAMHRLNTDRFKLTQQVQKLINEE